jgi:uncharacterized phage-associated protein
MPPVNRERLVNAIVFFAKNTRYCGKIKLFKLLYLLDFEHFRQTGKSVTGFEYQAWKFGPVPIDLMEEWEELGGDLGSKVRVVLEPVYDFNRQAVVVNGGVKFDEESFTPRQLRIMQDVAAQYCDEYSPKMIDVTHAQNGAWEKIWQDGAGAHKPIPYDLAVADTTENREDVLKVAEEQRMYDASLRLSRNAPAA